MGRGGGWGGALTPHSLHHTHVHMHAQVRPSCSEESVCAIHLSTSIDPKLKYMTVYSHSSHNSSLLKDLLILYGCVCVDVGGVWEGPEDCVFWCNHRSVFYVSGRGRRRRIFTPLFKAILCMVGSFAFIWWNICTSPASNIWIPNACFIIYRSHLTTLHFKTLIFPHHINVSIWGHENSPLSVCRVYVYWINVGHLQANIFQICCVL